MGNYVSFHGNTEVYEEDAYDYAMERISQDKNLQKEFEKMLVEWFYSANWIKEE